ncbi:hypothetical protein [Wenjunlia tyrosinilytica]|uniref:hypothetical protein n=1 Tax=Wenjunlia tyrosinilytica TaxID=1544741 RepID=UPI00166F4491|nr:hypothetical protein [Wenjunlia tyrosinilytica]
MCLRKEQAVAFIPYRVEEPRPPQGALTFGLVNSLGGYFSRVPDPMIAVRTVLLCGALVVGGAVAWEVVAMAALAALAAPSML